LSFFRRKAGGVKGMPFVTPRKIRRIFKPYFLSNWHEFCIYNKIGFTMYNIKVIKKSGGLP